jgi:WD40 repeat protein
MNLIDLLTSLLAAIFGCMVLGLEHDKSFLVQNDAGNVYAIALYGESLLLTSTNDVVQKSIETGKIERTFRAHSKSINSFVLTNDSRMITSSLDANIIVWNLDTGSILRRIWLGSENAMILSMSFQDGMVFAGCIDGKVRNVNLVTGRIVRAIGKIVVLLTNCARYCLFCDLRCGR